MTTIASAELIVIKSVQMNSSSQSIAGTLRAPKSSRPAMAVIPLAPRRSEHNAEPRFGFHATGAKFALLKHDPEKWVPVFGKDHAQQRPKAK